MSVILGRYRRTIPTTITWTSLCELIGVHNNSFPSSISYTSSPKRSYKYSTQSQRSLPVHSINPTHAFNVFAKSSTSFWRLPMNSSVVCFGAHPSSFLIRSAVHRAFEKSKNAKMSLP